MSCKKKKIKPEKINFRQLIIQGLIDLIVAVLGAYIGSRL